MKNSPGFAAINLPHRGVEQGGGLRGRSASGRGHFSRRKSTTGYWFPKMIGYMYSESLGKLHFWLMFIGANIAFFPMHFLGLAGMPRRIADYPDAFAVWNFIASIGSYISFAGLFVFLFGLAYAFSRKVHAPANPWGAGATTLEWTLPSPPRFHSHETLPRIY